MAFPADNNVNSFLVAESGRIQSNMDQQCRVDGDCWNPLIMRNNFPLGMGQQLNKITYERSGTDNAFAWNTLNINAAPPTNPSPDNANPTAVTINPAWTSYSFNLGYGAIDSNPLSIHDAALSLNFPDQLSATVENLEGNVRDTWFDRKQDQYDYWCGHKIIADLGIGTNPPESGATQPWLQLAPNSQLTVELLEYVYDRLIRDGGSDGLDTVDGEPTPYCIIDSNVYRQLIRNNEHYRKDIRYSNDADILINPLNKAKQTSLFNYKFLKNWKSPRYTFSGGVWTRVPFYENDAATEGLAQQPSIAYLNAPYVVTYVFHPYVYELLMYDPDSSYDNGVSFQSSTWMGKFKWMNTQDNVNNKDGMVGYFRALLGSAPRPIKPNLGFGIMHLRCGHDYSPIGCTSS